MEAIENIDKFFCRNSVVPHGKLLYYANDAKQIEFELAHVTQSDRGQMIEIISCTE